MIRVRELPSGGCRPNFPLTAFIVISRKRPICGRERKRLDSHLAAEHKTGLLSCFQVRLGSPDNLHVLLLNSLALAQTAKNKEEFAFVGMQVARSHPYVPLRAGMVPDATTATANAIGVPVFGRKQMDEEQPFRAELENGVRLLLGTLCCVPCNGGTRIVEHNKSDGRVLRLMQTLLRSD